MKIATMGMAPPKEFEPFAVSITFETADEANAFYQHAKLQALSLQRGSGRSILWQPLRMAVRAQLIQQRKFNALGAR